MAGKLQYVVTAGPVKRPETVQVGVLEKGLGQGTTSGEVVEMMSRRGQIGVPNWTEAWGVRLDKDGKVPDSPIDVRDNNYRGQIKELAWGQEGGSMIECRFLKGYNSIDRIYQDIVLNADKMVANTQDTEASADVFMLFLQSGDNFLDPETDKYLCQMLRIHYMNASSKSKDPKYEVSQFRELDFGAGASETDIKLLDDKFEAIKIVRDAASDNSGQQLQSLYTIMDGLADMGVKPSDLYPSLFRLAETKPKSFLDKVHEYKKNVSLTFQLLKSYEAIDFSKKGTIAAGVKEKNVIIEGLRTKDEESTIEWVLTNFLTVESNDTAVKLKVIADNITKTK